MFSTVARPQTGLSLNLSGQSGGAYYYVEIQGGRHSYQLKYSDAINSVCYMSLVSFFPPPPKPHQPQP